MKISTNKSAKRAFSLVLSLIMLVGTLFVANVSINVSAQGNGVVYWSGGIDTNLAGSGTAEDPYLITNAEELAALATNGSALDKTKHYKVSGVDTFYMYPDYSSWIKDVLDYSDISEVKSLLSSDDAPAWPSSATFEGVLDGNGATIYGLAAKNVANAGLFASLKGGTVKNFIIEKSFISATNNAGTIAGQGNWGRPDTTTYSPTNTITGCVVRDCYIEGASTRGGLLGNGGYSGLVIDSCLVADNFIGVKDGAVDNYPAFVSGSDANIGGTINVPTIVSNSIGIGVIPKAGDVATLAHKEIRNCFTTMSVSYSGSHITLTKGLTAVALKGKNAKLNASTLNWATDAQNGEGYWHVSATDYPYPVKTNGWSDIIVHHVWDGTAADSFAGGSGTADDPYIIETAEQLYKMVLDAGRELTGETKTVKLTVGITDASGNMLDKNGNITTDATKQAFEYSNQTVEVPVYRQCYYKIADGVTDIYLNDVEDGTLYTLKSLVNAGTAKAWNKAYNGKTEKTDSDGDGFWDEKSAFRGVFDGNGVTIHGLYSQKASSTDWLAYGDGFFPAIKGDAVVKNVTFDKSYINPTSGYGAVVSSSIGLDSANNNPEKNNNKGVLGDSCTSTNATFANIAIRNTYIAVGGYSTQGFVGAYNKAGILSAHGSPKSLSFVNCLYDGTGSTLEYDTNDYTAGIYMTANTASNATFVNCVSIGLQPLSCSTQASLAKFVNCYTTVAKNNFHSYNANDDVIVISQYDSQDDLPLLNWGVWSIKTVENDRKLPMPGISNSVITGYASIKKMVLDNVYGAGNYNYIGAHLDGTYGQYHKLIGSGTEEDPYLINSAAELATAISTGGVNISNKLYYKLTCDINLGSLAWIDTETVEQADGNYFHYIYVPFEGVLDGDGHTIYELNATAEKSGALIPELKGGTVKNLHIRNSAANAAIFAKGTGTVENCSAINCYVAAGDDALVSGSITATNSIINGTYYLSDGSKGTPTLDGVTWYGIAGKTPHLVNNAQTMPCADIDGDGFGDSYSATDLAALKNILLRKEDYKFAYGDANKDGKVNSGDLVILVRALAEDYTHVKDGFWRNIELGNFTIFYGENDNYDAARKLELYLESTVEGLDIVKAVSGSKVVSGEQSDKTAIYRHANDIEATPDGKLDIIVGNVGSYTTALTNNDYGITYDYENGVLWIQGANFTGVEQAVIDFINNSNKKTSAVYTVDCATLDEEKWPVTINGTTYYYAWGDEFDGVNGTVNEDKWEYTHNTTETVNMEVNGKVDGDKYMDMEMAFNSDLYKLFTVNDGKLTMRRGVYKDYAGVTEDQYSWGWVGLDTPAAVLDSGNLYATNSLGGKVSLGSAETGKDIYVESGKIITQHSLLAKQGYFELMASLPSDGHSFPAWWMMGSATGGNNNAYSESLFGKVYKYNPNYKGGNAVDPTNFAQTYRYQLPNAYLEIDIIELMQDVSVLGSSYQNNQLTGIYDYNLTTNIHKYYDTYASGNTCYIVNWDNGNSTTVSMSQFDTGSSPDWIASARANDHYFVTGIYNDRHYQAYGQKRLTTMRRYGFEWKVENGQYEFTLYIYNSEPDNNTANGVKDERIVFASSSIPIDYNENGANNVKDSDVVNQYMYFLIDNKYYTANQLYGRTDKTTLFTDLLTKENELDKTTFDIEYMRVYQADGRRDIVTPDTENFNNGNHFGY